MSQPRVGVLRRATRASKIMTGQTSLSSSSIGSFTMARNDSAPVRSPSNETAEGANGETSSKVTAKPPDRLDLPESPASRWYLHARAATLRQLVSLGFGLHNRSDPPAPSPTSTRWIDSTLSKWSGKGKIGLDIWHPPSYLAQKGTAEQRPAIDNDGQGAKGRAGVIVFHGGGFIIGNGTDDSRWAGALMNGLDAVVIAVNYRCAPGHPFPTPVEDCADAILYISREARSLGIDPDKLFISGFSAGGNLAFSSYLLLNSSRTWHYPDVPKPRIRGIIAFYPLLDFTAARKDKREASVKPEACLPESLTSLFDQSYLHPPPDRWDARLSPSRASDDLVETLPPVHLCCCEWDMLLQEGEVFRDRLRSMGKEVEWRLVKEEKHAWDKPPPLTVKPSVKVEYDEAIKSMRGWLGEGENTVTKVKQAKKDTGEVDKDDQLRAPKRHGDTDADGQTSHNDRSGALEKGASCELDSFKEGVMQRSHEERLERAGVVSSGGQQVGSDNDATRAKPRL